MLTVENLKLQRDGRTIFSGLGFSLYLGSAILVKGQNGSGKTSLLKIIAGLLKQSSGKLLFNNENIDDFRAEFNSDLQFIGHKNFLKQDLTVYENLKLYADLYGSEILIPSALNFFKISDCAHQKAKKLSAGMQKRVLLAKLLICESDIWILDEPTVNLDKAGKDLLKGLIKTKLENQGMVIISSHEENLFDFCSILNIEDFRQNEDFK